MNEVFRQKASSLCRSDGDFNSWGRRCGVKWERVTSNEGIVAISFGGLRRLHFSQRGLLVCCTIVVRNLSNRITLCFAFTYVLANTDRDAQQ